MTSTIPSRSRTRTRTALGALSVAAVLALSACGGSDPSGSGSGDASSSASSSASPSSDPSSDASSDAAGGPQPDLDAIPDVVAEVNGEQVTKEEFVPIYEAAFQQAAAQSQMSGEEPDEAALRQQTADNLVDTELLLQEAESRGLEVSDEAVDAELAELAEQNGMASADELLEAVQAQGINADQAREQVETQVMVEQLVADENGPIEPTDKELRQIYAQAKKQQAAAGAGGQQLPPFAQVRDQLEEQATSQETGKVATALVADLREDADITINL